MITQINPTLQKIQITLGLKGDGAVPEILPDTIGHLTVGPIGLLSVLETQLGIPSSDVSFTARLIQYLACLDQADNGNVFYSASFEADPFSVARTLLQWRDQWYLAGWRGTFGPAVPGKLSDMATVEQFAATEVEPGIGQRVHRVIELLADTPVAVESIHLRDRLTDFPWSWRRLIETLNVPVAEDKDPIPQGKKGSDLFKLQQQLAMNSGKGIKPSGDGSLIVVRADSAQDSAPVTALLADQWFLQAPNKTLAILAEARGDLLDESFEVIGAPRLGFGALSPWRPVFQILPLACELLWEPLNPTALLQFLSHSVGPIPSRFRDQLAQTVANVPGIGSADWESTIERCLEGEDEVSKQRQEQNIRYWLESPRFSPQTGVDSATLTERAQRVADWLIGAREATEDGSLQHLYFIALNQTLEFIKAIDRLKTHGRDPLIRDNVLRLIEDVRGTGAPVTDRQAEVCTGQSRALRAEHSGAFSSPVDKVIWWNLQATDRVQRWPWSRTERQALEANGVLLQSENEQLSWLGRAWLRPILNAREQCTLILHNDAERHHPVWDQIAGLTKDLPIISLADCQITEALGIPQSPLEPQPLPPKTRWWQLPESVSLTKRESESFSSLDAYIHSPYQWLLKYAARIRPGSLDTVSDGNQLRGNLTHRLYEEFLSTHPDIPAIKTKLIPKWVDQHIAPLLQQQGALLLEPGRQAECEVFITVMQESLSALIEHLQHANVVEVQMELSQEGRFAGGTLNGSIDLLARRADGQEAVVDIKWGGKSYRLASLLDSSYLQLATYAQLRRGAGATSSPQLSYFIVVDAHMLNLDHDYFPEAEVITPTNQENWLQLWKRFEYTWKWRKKQFDRGLIEVTITDTEPTDDSVPGDKGLTIPDASDAFSEFTVVTGWGPDA